MSSQSKECKLVKKFHLKLYNLCIILQRLKKYGCNLTSISRLTAKINIATRLQSRSAVSLTWPRSVVMTLKKMNYNWTDGTQPFLEGDCIHESRSSRNF